MCTIFFVCSCSVFVLHSILNKRFGLKLIYELVFYQLTLKHSNMHNYVLTFLLYIIFPIPLFADYICANAPITCTDKCKDLVDAMKKEGAVSTWKDRHNGIGKVYAEHHVKVSIEIGVARGELAAFLLHKIPKLEIHGIDPFVGGYDDADVMSSTLRQYNSSQLWMHAVLQNLRQFGCRYKHHLGHSKTVINDFNRKFFCVFIYIIFMLFFII